ncbi:asparagine synthase (glutamine-hydrolyzing) [Flavobacteriaceae bacterium]|nr:asparagine synthase (glutamine-hydrolyzing) [Flavobacteriaceae bacterium]
MCGIAGFIGFSENVKMAIEANKIQEHRGPDSQAVWKNDFLALAHQRLSIIDLSSRSDQPFIKGQYVMIYNGEIYNYQELKESYLQGVEFKTGSDTEVVIEMFHKYGPKALDYFIGMFAFAIYDQSNNKIFAARDHFGIKPFYIYNTNRLFAFASELKTLSTLISTKKEINKKALVCSLNYLWIPGSQTIFKEFSKLPPAHYLTYDVTSATLEIEKYWTIDTELKKRNEAETIKSLSKEFDESIKRHMVADVPVSAFLSGGLDSSMISVAASKINPNISTYTIGTAKEDKKVENMPQDEKYAKYLADIHNFDHHEIILSSDITNMLPQMVKMLDEPIGDPAALNTFLICKAAREKGVKVLLSGMGADEIFCGYRRQKALLISKRYKKIPKLFRIIIKFIVGILPVKIGGYGLRLSRWSKKFISFAEMPVEEAYRMSYSYYNKTELQSLLKDDVSAEVESIYNDHKQLFNHEYVDDVVNQMCYTDIHMFMNGLNLTYTDRSSMAASVEVRVPFIDKKIITKAMSIPGMFKYKDNESKYILKKVAEELLPRNIIYRPKASFGAPIRSWISGDLKWMIDENLSKVQIEKRGIFNYDYVKKIINEDREGIVDNAYRIYQLLTIELWFKEFID